MPKLYTHLSPRVVVAGAFVVAAAVAVVIDLARGLISARNKNQPYPVDTTKSAKFDAVSDDEVVVIDKAKMDRIISDTIDVLVRADIAIKKIEVLVGYPGAVADLNAVTNNAKDYIEPGAGFSLDSLYNDLLRAASLVDQHMKKSSIPTTSKEELSRIGPDIHRRPSNESILNTPRISMLPIKLSNIALLKSCSQSC